MKVYDISQEVFSCEVYPGDPIPEKNVLKSMQKGEVYNLTAFSMCAHNGTHIDAPFHFIRDGKTVDEICLEAFVGMAYVAEHNGIVTGNDATEIIEKAKKRSSDVVLLEGIRLSEVSEGVYFLNAAPLNLSGADGSPCRAVLIDVDER